MHPKKIWSNLAVSDLDRTSKFYTALGFKPNGTSEELTSFLFGENQFVMHFFLKDILKTSMKGEMADTQKANEVLFSLSAGSQNQVDDWAKEVEKAGGKIIWGPKHLEKDIMVLILPIRMATGSMYFIWKGFDLQTVKCAGFSLFAQNPLYLNFANHTFK